ncbi:MAG: hypothetical protein EXR71_20970 [Myxococcales bacterium]|nr:hypothetical protein [Myxococcales bacterium]
MDRITRIRIQNVRAIESIDLEMGRPLTVLIGENGSGKSTIVECLELLRKAADPSFMQQLYAQHRGMPGLLRKGATELSLGLRMEDDEGTMDPIDYAFKLRTQGAGAVVSFEQLLVGVPLPGKPRLAAIQRGTAKAKIFNQQKRKLEDVPAESVVADQLLVASFGNRPPQRAIDRLLVVLRGIEVHLGFDTLAAWAAQSVQRQTPLRGTAMLLPATRLTLLGHNLASAWSALKNLDDAHWRHTMALVRLGLGEAVDSVNTVPDSGGGYVGLSLKRTDLPEPIPAANLSDGQLSWLAFVALARLSGSGSLLVIDEPELHLHPQLLGGVITLLTSIGTPVLISTHADRVLELIEEPAEAVRVCSLDEGCRATVARVDANELPKWIAHFGDFGRLRAAGYLSRVLLPATAARVEEGE